MTGRLLDRFPHIIVAVEVKDVGDEVQGILIVLDLGVEARQVETVRQVVLVNFAKVLVASRRDELKRHGAVSNNGEIHVDACTRGWGCLAECLARCCCRIS